MLDLKNSGRWVVQAALLLALGIGTQSLHLPQLVTGSVINAILLVSAVLIGPWGAVAVGLLTPVTAFVLGQLNPVLAPAIPFIMAGNGLLSLIFGYGRKLNTYLALVVAAGVKYLLLSAAVLYIVRVPGPVSIALRLPQLFTALIGGAAALFVLEGLAAAGLVSRPLWPGLAFRVGKVKSRD